MNGKKIYLTEQQMYCLLETQILVESSFKKNMSFDEVKDKVREMRRKGILKLSVIAAIIAFFGYTNQQAKQLRAAAMEEPTEQVSQNNLGTEEDIKNSNLTWKLASSNVQATVYNAVPEQCNDDIFHTASMFRLNLSNVLGHRIIAMERTFMKNLGLRYGDVVKIEGTGKWDGVWQVQDTMNKRFAGKQKIDLLVPNDIKYGKWDNVKLYTLSDGISPDIFKSDMRPQLSKKQAQIQANNIRKGLV